MKNFLLALGLLVVVYGCEPADPAGKSASSSPPAVVPGAKRPAVQKTEAKKPPASSGKSLRQEVSDAVDYGIGAAQMQAKKNATEKIDQINQQKNADLEKALNE